MEFGLSRFLEMFEERFGRVATSILLGTFGLAVFGYCIEAIVKAGVYLYHEAMHAPLAASREDLASHLAFFGVQFLTTLFLSVLVWNWFIANRWRAFQKKMTGYKAEISQVAAKVDALKEKATQLATIQDSFEKMRAALDVMREEMAKRNISPGDQS